MGNLLELNYFNGQLNKWLENEYFDLGLFLFINFNFNDSFDSIMAQLNWQWNEHILSIEFVLSIWAGCHLKDMIDSLKTLREMVQLTDTSSKFQKLSLLILKRLILNPN